MKVTFTGTRKGMTPFQRELVRRLLEQLKPEYAFHGDCIGADAEFHDEVRRLCQNCHIIGFPCHFDSQRAFKDCDSLELPAPPLERNGRMVEEATVVIACPGEDHEVLRSGTWATIRRARKCPTVRRYFVIGPTRKIESGGLVK